MRHSVLLTMPILVLALGGCATSVPDVPSLAPRPIEHQPVLPPDAQSEPQTPVDPALAVRLDRIVADAKAGHARFDTERAAAAAALSRARGAAEGSEAWIAGQQVLSGLDAARAPVRDAAAAIDAMRVDPAYAGAGDRAVIEAAAAQIAALAAAEADAVDGLTG